ncbi:MAG: protein kinase [Candidatus Woesearchaeota archaeon]
MTTQEANLEQRIDDDRFEVYYDRVLGRGDFGVVYAARDLLMDELVAIKILDPIEEAEEKMEHRNLTLLKILKKEARKSAGCANNVHYEGFADKNENLFLKMDHVYETDLAKYIGDKNSDGSSARKEDRKYLGQGLTMHGILKIMGSLANGIKECHNKKEKDHGDIKPDNVLLEGLEAYLGDFGAATYDHISKRSKSPRDNIGHRYIRAPSQFNKNAHPSKDSDVWSFCSIMYRMFTGEYIFEKEIDEIVDLETIAKRHPTNVNKIVNEKINDFYHEIRWSEEYKKVIKEKLKKVPKKFRKLLENGFGACDYKNKLQDGDKLKDAFDKVTEELATGEQIKTHIKKWTKPLAVSALLLGGLLYAAVSQEASNTGIPDVPLQNIIHPDEELEEKPLEFSREKDLDLPEYQIGATRRGGSRDTNIKLVTDNRYVAYLMKKYFDTSHYMCAAIGGLDLINDTQADMYMDYTNFMEKYKNSQGGNQVFKTIASCVEVGIIESQTPEGKIDLEDACTIARVGRKKLDSARRLSGSFDFKDYIKAKYKSEEYVIPEDEQKFIKQWISNIR